MLSHIPGPGASGCSSQLPGWPLPCTVGSDVQDGSCCLLGSSPPSSNALMKG